MSRAPDLALLARRLAEAEASLQPVGPLTGDAPGLSVADAYAIQRINAEARVARGETIRGHKIGLTAVVMQEKFGVKEPDYGHLLDTMFVDDGTTLDLSRLIDPQIEVEPAFILGAPLHGPGIGIADVLAATEWIVPSFEIIDSRIRDWDIKLQDTIADNGSSALVVLGAARRRPDEIPLDDLMTVLSLDGVPVERGNTSAILGHPAAGIAWLANALGSHGVRLEAGQVVLPGTAIRSHRIAPHQSARGEIDKLGSVTLSFTGRPSVVPSKPEPLSAASLEATIRRYFDGCNQANRDLMMSTMAPDAVHYFPAGAPQGPFLSARQIADGWVDAVARLGSQWTIESVLVDPVRREAVIEWTHWKTKLGTHLRGNEWYRFDAAGRIAEIRAYYACPPAPGGAQDSDLGGFDYARRGYTLTPPLPVRDR
jgi:2-keto-4-pentenoate hydratase